MKKNNDTLHLVLKKKWWDMIESGEKKEEYRCITELYIKRFCLTKQLCGCERSRIKGECLNCFYDNEYVFYPYEKVCLHRGYTNITMTRKCVDMRYGKGNPEWGAPKEDAFIIKLGKRTDNDTK